ncbi:MAG: M60 family metallopeptidase [Paludibacteraceae bacterium]
MRSEGGYVNRYEKAFNLYFAAENATDAEPLPHNTPGLDVFCKLIPFWQLDRYMNLVLEKTGMHGAGFYEDLYEFYRKNDPNASARTTGRHQLFFVEQICRLANLNLEDFFKRWGFLSPINTIIDDYATSTVLITADMINATLTNIRQYPKPETTACEYLTDANVNIFKTRAELVTGAKATVVGTKFKAMPTGWTNAVAFEVRQDNATGKIKYVFVPDGSVVTQNFSAQSLNFDSTTDHLYAVSVSGERREVPLEVLPGPIMPAFSTADTPKWYFIKNSRNAKYLTYVNSTTNIYARTLSSNIQDQQLWRFEGDNNGFRIISKSDGTELKKQTLTQGIRFMPVATGTGDVVFKFEISSNTTYGTDKWCIRYDTNNGLNANSTNEEEVTTYSITDNGSVWEFTSYTSTATNDIADDNKISVFYSKSSECVCVKNKPENMEVLLYNVNGDCIKRSYNSTINIGSIPNGTYFVKTANDFIKFIKN